MGCNINFLGCILNNYKSIQYKIMNTYMLKILFVISPSRINKKGLVPLFCRLTFMSKRKQFATGLFIKPDDWDSKRQIAHPPNDQNTFINNEMSLIKTKLIQAFLLLQVKENSFTAEDIYKTFKGEKIQKEYNVIEFYKHYLNRLKTLVGIDIKLVTWNKFLYIKDDVKTFVKRKYKTNDIQLKHLEANFLTELEYYFKVEKKLKQITINKKIQRFRKVIKMAVAEGYLEKDPFMLYKSKQVKKEIIYLTPEELEQFEKHVFTQRRLQVVQDLFVFSCYTGLAYNELSKLDKSHILKGFDDNLWIQMKREKTNKPFSVPLLPKPLLLIKKYRSADSKVFPVISNQKYNSYLKELSTIIGIDKKLTTHTARRTFASTVLLYNDVPMEIVSELLGHSSMKITQDSYGKIVQKKISEEMIRLNKKFIG